MPTCADEAVGRREENEPCHYSAGSSVAQLAADLAVKSGPLEALGDGDVEEGRAEMLRGVLQIAHGDSKLAFEARVRCEQLRLHKRIARHAAVEHDLLALIHAPHAASCIKTQIQLGDGAAVHYMAAAHDEHGVVCPRRVPLADWRLLRLVILPKERASRHVSSHQASRDLSQL